MRAATNVNNRYLTLFTIYCWIFNIQKSHILITLVSTLIRMYYVGPGLAIVPSWAEYICNLIEIYVCLLQGSKAALSVGARPPARTARSARTVRPAGRRLAAIRIK